VTSRVLVEQAVAQQRPDEGGAAGDRDVLARLLLQPGELLGDIALDQRRVLPFDPVQRRGDDELRRVVHVVRTLHVAALVRPVAGERLVGHPA
jgi:hypothetical protein